MTSSSVFGSAPLREGEPERSSDRKFGLTFAAVGLLIGAVKLWWGENTGWFWLAGGGALIALATTCPRVLAPLNRVWGQLSIMLHRLVSPIVMFVVFITTVIPVGLIMRALGKDPLRLRPDPEAATYWIDRKPPGPAPGTMKNQF
jgi:Saxitoxin biosynthesis operon protein SxtJ